MNKNKDEIKSFLDKINSLNPEVELPSEIFKESIKYLDMVYKYQIQYILNSEDFFSQLKPKVKEFLSFQ